MIHGPSEKYFYSFYHEFAYLSRVVLSLMTMDNNGG